MEINSFRSAGVNAFCKEIGAMDWNLVGADQEAAKVCSVPPIAEKLQPVVHD
jgi:hypothetical protein